jgi:hypothetical protein
MTATIRASLLSRPVCRLNRAPASIRATGIVRTWIAALQDSLYGLVESPELLHLVRMLSEPPRDPRHGPGEGSDRLYGHDPVGHFGQDMRGRQASDFLVFDTLEQLGASGAVPRIRGEVVNKEIRIEKDRLSGNQIGERHACSMGSNSTSSARRLSVSWSPVHGIIPAVSVTQLLAVCTVTWTRSCSSSGNGWAGWRTPFT